MGRERVNGTLDGARQVGRRRCGSGKPASRDGSGANRSDVDGRGGRGTIVHARLLEDKGEDDETPPSEKTLKTKEATNKI